MGKLSAVARATVLMAAVIAAGLMLTLAIPSAHAAPRCDGTVHKHLVTINESSAGERGEHLVLQGDPTKVCTGDTVEWVAGKNFSNPDFAIEFSDVPPMSFSVKLNDPLDYKITVTQTGDEDWYKYTITSGGMVLDPHCIIMPPTD
jgi:hypothetical protein